MTQQDKLRAAFEVWAKWFATPVRYIEAEEQYANMTTEIAYQAWQAAIEHDRQQRNEERAAVQIVAELAAIIPLKDTLKATQTGRTMVEHFKGLVDCQGRGEPVAWMHDSPIRVDVIHASVKKLLQDANDAAGYLHRPLDKSKRYTIPLYAAQPANPTVKDSLTTDIMPVTPEEDEAWAEVERRQQGIYP
ncbi:hypothetical protein H0A71_06345 [Alcaligenaceae bacterium]|nr:hypothetical protein [Alcaligenaceae bacterium]